MSKLTRRNINEQTIYVSVVMWILNRRIVYDINKMIPVIYDNLEENGIDLEFDMENGMAIKLFMDDAAARDMINIIQNKLDGHFKK